MIKIRVLGESGDIEHIKIFFKYASDYLSLPKIVWTGEESNILVVSAETQKNYKIPWTDINIVVSETFQQIINLLPKFNLTKKYIFVTESYADPAELNRVFNGIDVLYVASVFKEVYMFGNELFTPWSLLSWSVKKRAGVPPNDFFSIVGRRSPLRSHFINELSKLDLSKSLVKYHGVTHNQCTNQQHLDQFNFQGLEFNITPYKINLGIGTCLLPKIIQPSLYNNFKFEVQCETDTSKTGGWNITEYHVTEKTIKPLISNKPCLMLGAKGYNTWLSSFGIDLGHSNFDTSYDTISDDYHRTSAMLGQLQGILDDNQVSASESIYANNIGGLAKLSQFSTHHYTNLFEFIQGT